MSPEGTPELLARVLERARQLTDSPLLVRLDSGNDAIENIATFMTHEEQRPEAVPVHDIVKWNPRRDSPEKWLAYAEAHGGCRHPQAQ
jgi:hypothetical protein